MATELAAQGSNQRRSRPHGATIASRPEDTRRILRIGKQEVAMCGATEALHRRIKDVAPTPLPVLILGETGSGKEWLARAAHHYGKNSDGPFKAVNCGSIPRSLLEATLFGAERGSYTGSLRTSLGIFEQAKGGTVFLDEIGELPLDAQAALLRILDGQPYLRIGGADEVEPNVRIVAATNRSLVDMIRTSQFREDLYYRLCTITLSVPPLRERKDEVGVLASIFLDRANAAFDREVSGMSQEFVRLLEEYAWPGNVRQLRNVIEASVFHCRDEILKPDDAPDELFVARRDEQTRNAAAGFCPDPAAGTYREQVRDFEVALITAALRRTNGNQREAAELLQLPQRTLVHKLQSYRIR